MDICNPSSSRFSEFLQRLSETDNCADVFCYVVNNVHHFVPCDRASVVEHEPESDKLKIITVWGLQDLLGPGTIRAKQVGQEFASNIVTDAYSKTHPETHPETQHDADQESRRMLQKMGVVSTINTPLITRAGVIGSLNAASIEGTYNKQHLNVLKQIASMASAAIERIELTAALDKELSRHQSYTKRLQQINKLAEVLAQAPTVVAAINLVGDAAKTIVPATRISYIELEENRESIAIVGLAATTADEIGTRVPLSDSGLEPALLNGQSLHIKSIEEAKAKAHRALFLSGHQQLWAVPLYHGRSLPSVLVVTSTTQWTGSNDTTSLVHTLCRLLGATIERIDAQKSAENSLRTMVDDNPSLLLMLDEQGLIKQVSRFGAQQFGYQNGQLTATPFESLHSDEVHQNVKRKLEEWSNLSLDSVASHETQMKLYNGSLRWVRQTVRRTRDHMGKAQLLIACEDIHDAKKLQNELKIQARTDALTQLPNRTEFADQLDRQIRDLEGTSGSLAVFFMDLDHFKNINDTMGHQTGDLILSSLARRMETLASEHDVVARIGGDEFLMLVTEPGEDATLMEKGQALIRAVKQDIILDGQKFRLGISIGSARYPDDAQCATELIKKADLALYHAKGEGRHQVQAYNSELLDKLSTQVSLENDLKDAIQNGELSVVYQPKVAINTGQVKSLEALVRWYHPTRGVIPPDIFIPIAEQCGLISKVTEFVLSESLGYLKNLLVNHPNLTMAVNVSAVEFAMHQNLKSLVLATLEKYSLPAAALELELTETALLKHPQQAAELIKDLSKRGTTIAIDDFGTGYASLNYLIQFPIEAIKIDRSFVSNIINDKRKQAVVRGVIGIANDVGVMCIAEGVETAEQAQWLLQNHCSQAQGYLYCKPLSPIELQAFLLDQDNSQVA